MQNTNERVIIHADKGCFQSLLHGTHVTSHEGGSVICGYSLKQVAVCEIPPGDLSPA